MATEAGVDIVDAALSPLAGLTSQPSLNSVVAALKNSPYDTGFDLDHLQLLCDYWQEVRSIYEPFEGALTSGSAEIYKYEIPGGQYTNLKPQVESFGLGHRFKEVKEMYRAVNDMFGDIIKVTPTSKVVGDMAIFMVQNDLTPETLRDKGRHLSFPDSVVDYFKGMLGQPQGGFPADLQDIILKGEEPLTCRPGAFLPPADFGAFREKLAQEYHVDANIRNVLSHALYPKVYGGYLDSLKEYGHLDKLESHVFFHGLREGETSEIDLDEGKIIIVKLVEISASDENGYRTAAFEVNGNRREIKVYDKDFDQRHQGAQTPLAQTADPKNPKEIGAPISGTVSKILAAEGDQVEVNKILLVIEAMKIETNVAAAVSGTIGSILVSEGQSIQSGQLLMHME
jgi:pyruvate carboxylase